MSVPLPDLIQEACRRGVRFERDGEHISVTAPRALPMDFKESLRSARDEITAIVNSDLGAYLNELISFCPSDSKDLPPAPPYADPPERAVAWAAWWGAVERARISSKTKDSRK